MKKDIVFEEKGCALIDIGSCIDFDTYIPFITTISISLYCPICDEWKDLEVDINSPIRSNVMACKACSNISNTRKQSKKENLK